MNEVADVKFSFDGTKRQIVYVLMATRIFWGLTDPLHLKNENNDLRRKEAVCNFQWT